MCGAILPPRGPLSRESERKCAPQAERTRRRPASARVASSEIEGTRRPRSVTRRHASSEMEVVVVVVVRVSAESPPLSGDARRTPQTRRGALARPAKRRRGRVGGGHGWMGGGRPRFPRATAAARDRRPPSSEGQRTTYGVRLHRVDDDPGVVTRCHQGDNHPRGAIVRTSSRDPDVRPRRPTRLIPSQQYNLWHDMT